MAAILFSPLALVQKEAPVPLACFLTLDIDNKGRKIDLLFKALHAFSLLQELF